MGKKYCDIGEKWCKFLRHNLCDKAKLKIKGKNNYYLYESPFIHNAKDVVSFWTLLSKEAKKQLKNNKND